MDRQRLSKQEYVFITRLDKVLRHVVFIIHMTEVYDEGIPVPKQTQAAS
jgi:hypothetical protein